MFFTKANAFIDLYGWGRGILQRNFSLRVMPKLTLVARFSVAVLLNNFVKHRNQMVFQLLRRVRYRRGDQRKAFFNPILLIIKARALIFFGAKNQWPPIILARPQFPRSDMCWTVQDFAHVRQMRKKLTFNAPSAFSCERILRVMKYEHYMKKQSF